ncbi:hypothetical protein [Convivina intestini]|uniref:Uncharacterized protein n=1 Tax=Convivina intestini TaxID=1505726 RepID=A0A2U1D7N2_9LACO|nr:hypothetical protein [Convivina intestini]PVY83694.1 hypothetical protein C7384_1064 [Convivina intestini]CAH1855207.1 hypothetical protein R077811_01016 [Convivina intestini]SDB92120.1 hypothetical protein SAMN05216341_1055 [Leuconostocaceae bacterium R-53105]
MKRKNWDCVIYVGIVVLLFCGTALSISHVNRTDKYKKMIVAAKDVPMWQADTQPLVSENEFKHNFIEANHQGKLATQLSPDDLSGIVLPGLRGAWSVDHRSRKASFGNNWVPQGITQNNQYIFVSLYDGDHQRNSLIMVIDKASQKYVKSLILDSKSHVGGLAYDPQYQRLWWSNDGTQFAGLSYTDVTNIKQYQPTKDRPILKSERIAIPWASRTSGIAYHNHEMFIVKYGLNAATRTIAVMPFDANTGLPTDNQRVEVVYQGTSFKEYVETLFKEKKISALASGFDRMQGLAITKSNLALITQSNGDDNSVLMVVQPNGQTGDKFDYRDDVKDAKKVQVPSSVEQVSLDNTSQDVSLIFESGAKMYREQGQHPKIIDRIVTIPSQIVQ